MKHLLLPILLLTSCVTEQKCNRLFPPSVTITTDTQFVPVNVQIPGATIYDTIRLHDSLVILQLTEKVTIRETDNGRAELRYWVDKYGNLVIECQAKDQIVELLNKYVTNNRVEVRNKIPEWIYGAAIAWGLICFLLGQYIINRR
jgi:hypothetical protein